MKLWRLATFYAVSLLILSGCGAKPTPKKEPVIDATLPIVKLTNSGVFVDMNAIAFEWVNISDPRVKGLYIYKNAHSDAKGELVYYGTIDNRFATHYLDKNIKPDTKYSYSFRTFSSKAESKESRIIDVNSLPVLESVSWIHSIQGMPRSAKIIWRPHGNKKVKLYIIERKTLEEEKWEEIAKIDSRLSAEYIDSDLKDKYTYKYRIRVVTYDNIVSTPSEIVKVVTKALPREAKNISASRNLPKQIKLDWDKTTQKDFSLYYVYRSEDIKGDYELIATLHNNNHIDKIAEDGKQYFYRVSVVDKDGLESKHNLNSIQGLTLEKPSAPAVIEAKLINNKIRIIWSKTDPRTKSYVVTKRYKKGWFDEIIEDYEGITSKNFIDTQIEPNMAYYYKVYGVDSNQIKSTSSIEVEVKTPKLDETVSTSSTEKNIPVVDSKVQKSEVITPVADLNVNEI